jgi:hypothetical protein
VHATGWRCSLKRDLGQRAGLATGTAGTALTDPTAASLPDGSTNARLIRDSLRRHAGALDGLPIARIAREDSSPGDGESPSLPPVVPSACRSTGIWRSLTVNNGQ